MAANDGTSLSGGRVAQLVRAPPLQPGGRRFEPGRAHRQATGSESWSTATSACAASLCWSSPPCWRSSIRPRPPTRARRARSRTSWARRTTGRCGCGTRSSEASTTVEPTTWDGDNRGVGTDVHGAKVTVGSGDLPSTPSWAPDGSKFAFAKLVDDGGDFAGLEHAAIFVYTVATGETRQVTHPEDGGVRQGPRARALRRARGQRLRARVQPGRHDDRLRPHRPGARPGRHAVSQARDRTSGASRRTAGTRPRSRRSGSRRPRGSGAACGSPAPRTSSSPTSRRTARRPSGASTAPPATRRRVVTPPLTQAITDYDVSPDGTKLALHRAQRRRRHRVREAAERRARRSRRASGFGAITRFAGTGDGLLHSDCTDRTPSVCGLLNRLTARLWGRHRRRGARPTRARVRRGDAGERRRRRRGRRSTSSRRTCR